MTVEQKMIRNKVGLFQLAKQLGNVLQACRVFGHSQDPFINLKNYMKWEVNNPFLDSAINAVYFLSPIPLKHRLLPLGQTS